MNSKRKMRYTSEKGITLIALVITIIVLLILAGVTISMVLGDEGLIAQAQSAKKTHEKKAGEEDGAIDELELDVDYALYELSQKQGETPRSNNDTEIIAKTTEEEKDENGNTILKEFKNEKMSFKEAMEYEAYDGEATIKVNQKIYLNEPININHNWINLDLAGSEIIFSNTIFENNVSCIRMSTDYALGLYDSSEEKTGKIICRQTAMRPYNEKYDVNNDGVVCMGDQNAILYAVLMNKKDAKMDVSGNGAVDSVDLADIIANVQYRHIMENENIYLDLENAVTDNYLEQGCTHHRCYTNEEYYEMAIAAQ